MKSSREIERYLSLNTIPPSWSKKAHDDIEKNGRAASNALPNFANIVANWEEEDGPMTFENFRVVVWKAQSDHLPAGESIDTFLQGVQDEARRQSLEEGYEHRILNVFPSLLIEQYVYWKLRESNSLIILCSYDLDTRKKIDFVIQSLDERYILCIAVFMATGNSYDLCQKKAKEGLSFLAANHLNKQLLPYCSPSGNLSPDMDAELRNRALWHRRFGRFYVPDMDKWIPFLKEKLAENPVQKLDDEALRVFCAATRFVPSRELETAEPELPDPEPKRDEYDEDGCPAWPQS